MVQFPGTFYSFVNEFTGLKKVNIFNSELFTKFSVGFHAIRLRNPNISEYCSRDK